jgi:hypothetical protein
MRNEGTTGEQLNSSRFLFIVLGVPDAARNSLNLRSTRSLIPTVLRATWASGP